MKQYVVYIKRFESFALIVYGVYFDYLLSRNMPKADSLKYSAVVYGFLPLLVVAIFGFNYMLNELIRLTESSKKRST